MDNARYPLPATRSPLTATSRQQEQAERRTEAGSWKREAGSVNVSCFGQLLFELLLAKELGVDPARPHELVVGAALDDAPSPQYHDHVGVTDRRHAVRDDERSPRAHDPAQPRQDGFLRIRVHR